MSKLAEVTKACIIFLLWAAIASALPAQTLTILHSFDSTDGSDPQGALVQAPNGDLYGTTLEGGSGFAGTAFKITPVGIFATLHTFCASGDPQCPDGIAPQSALIVATDGDMYGTTAAGGEQACDCGTIFSLNPSGALSTLHTFCSDGNRCPDGATPYAGLVQGADGDFYGPTANGGQSDHGTVYKITPAGTLTTLYAPAHFSPDASTLIEGTDGNFYGTTAIGGGLDGDGTVFRMTPSGVPTILHVFNHSDGAEPLAGVVEGTDGNFYGTTLEGGPNNSGTIFKITPQGNLTTLYYFCSQGSGTASACPDGSGPNALSLATDGNFYGTTNGGGANVSCSEFNGGCGTIFRITPAGILTTLYSFCSQQECVDGAAPVVPPVQDTNGIFYGTTVAGGAFTNQNCNVGDYPGCGTVYSFAVGLGPFVRTNPTAAKVGKKIGILGTDLTGATSVSFNGVATAFRIVSPSFIEAKVPSGATTGTIQVQLPSGTLSSNVPFIVLP